MSDSTTIDYEIAFKELSTLNKLFTSHNDYMPPSLNPQQFTLIDYKDSGAMVNDVIVRGERSGLHYLAVRRQLISGYSFSGFVQVEPSERTIIDWVYAQ